MLPLLLVRNSLICLLLLEIIVGIVLQQNSSLVLV